MDARADTASSQNNYRHNSRVRLLYGGREYFDLMEQLILQAQSTIHLHVYIFDSDETGQRIAHCLTEAARRGVQVYVLVDGYASRRLRHSLVSDMTDAGVHFYRFNPLFKSRNFYFGRRLHHKVFVVDSSYSLVGGINIADKYNSNHKEPPWLDMALYVHGETARELEAVCCEVWNSCPGAPKLTPPDIHLYEPGHNDISVKVRRNDWLKGKNQIWKSYADLLANAQEEVIIACSYFLPGWNFRKLMKRAIKRGVKIMVMVAGPSDVAIAKNAERFLYRWMFDNNIKVFEYQKSILHTKVALADNRYLTIGSYNINNISAYASIELNLNVRNKYFVTEVAVQLRQLIKEDCKEILRDNYNTSFGWLTRMWQELCYGIIKTLLYIFTFYLRREYKS